MTVGVHFKAITATPAGTACVSGAVTTTSGSTVIVTIIANDSGSTGGFTGTPIQDSKSNTWIQIGSDLLIDSTQSRIQVYKAVNITGGAGHTFTCNPNSFSFGALLGTEITGAPAAPTITNSAGNSDAATPYVAGTAALAAAGTIVGIFWSNAPSGTETDTWGGSFASGDKVESLTDANNGIPGSLAAVDKAAGTYNGSVTTSGVTITDTGNFTIAVQTTASATGSTGAILPGGLNALGTGLTRAILPAGLGNTG